MWFRQFGRNYLIVDDDVAWEGFNTFVILFQFLSVSSESWIYAKRTLYENPTVRQYAVMLVIGKFSLIQYRNIEILYLYLQYV